MGEWITGAAINVVGSIGINFGTNLLKLGHNQKDRQALLEATEPGEKPVSKKSVTQFQAWRFGVVVFTLGNCINFISFGYAAQSLLAALGSVQFVSNVAFAYVVLNENVTGRILLATAFIVFGNIFLVAFGNHQSSTFTDEELLANYQNRAYLVYCACLIVVVIIHHLVYKHGRQLMVSRGEQGVGSLWRTLVPLSYAIVSGAIGTHSVLFAKSLSILLRTTLSGDSQLDGFFTYVVLVMFVGTASFWMARLNEGLAMFEAILIVPMMQIAWTFFSIFTGFIYFEEYEVFDGFKASMFAVGIIALFLGMSLLAPQGFKASGTRSSGQIGEAESMPLMNLLEGSLKPVDQTTKDRKSVFQSLVSDAVSFLGRAKIACKMALGLGQDRIHASSVFAMPLIASSRIQWKSSNLNSEWFARLTSEDLEALPGTMLRI